MKRLGAIAIVLLGSLALHATTLQPMSVERLAQASEKIVRARAVQSWVEWNSTRTMLYTLTRFEVEDTLKGGPVRQVVVKQMGGSADGYTQKAAGVRHWHAGQRAVLFLTRSRETAQAMLVTGLVQGDFRISRNPAGAETVSNGVAGVEVFNGKSRQVGKFRGEPMTLENLESRVRRAVTQ